MHRSPNPPLPTHLAQHDVADELPGSSLSAHDTIERRSKGNLVVPRFIEWVWHIKGSLALAPGQSSDEAFDRLAPLFHQTGTSHDLADNTLTFSKKDQAAQDKMSIFDGGVLQIKRGVAGPVLHYHLASRALLLCFLAPLLFLVVAQLTVVVRDLESSSASAVEKEPTKKSVELPQHPIDKALGAPAPEKPKEDGAGKSEEDDKGPSPTPAYVFAAIFAALYVAGRVLEDRLIHALFKRTLLGS